MSTALAPGPYHLHIVDDPFRISRSRSCTRPFRYGLTLRAVADEVLGDMDVAAIVTERGRQQRIIEPDDLTNTLVPPNSVIHLVAIPAGIEISLGAIIASVLVSAAVSAITYLLFAPDDPPTPVENDTSKTYGWNGVSTNYKSAGAPIPLVYGYHGVGGLVISQEITQYTALSTTGPTSTVQDEIEVLNLLIAVAQGPVKSIGGITEDADGLEGDQLPAGLKINGNSADNLDGVKAWVRLGGLDQDTIPGFSFASSIYPVGLPIANYDDNGVVITGFTDSADFDMPVEGDRVTVRIAFPNGLYKLNTSNGAAETQSVAVNIRYQELDGAGVPTGPTVEVYSGGGFVFTEKTLSPFSRALSFPLYDPATYTTPVLSNAVKFNGSYSPTGDYLITNATIGNAGEAMGPRTFECWIQRVPVGSQPTVVLWSLGEGVFQDVSLGQKWAPVSFTGVMARFIAVGQSTTGKVQLEITVGGLTPTGANGFEQLVLPDPAFFGDIYNPGTNAFMHLVVVLGEGNDPLGERVRVYANGIEVFDGQTSIRPRFADTVSGRKFKLAAVDGIPYGEFGEYAIIDHIRHWERVVSGSAIAASFQSVALSPISDKGLVLSYDFDGITGSSPYLISGKDGTTIDAFFYNNSAQFDLTNNGILATNASANTVKRAKYRIQVERLTNQIDTSQKKGNTTFQDLSIKLDQEFCYPDVALLGLQIPAQSDVSGGRPSVLVPVEGKLVPVRTGTSSDGSPILESQYSNNPWHILCDLFLDDRALGQFHSTSDLDWDEIDSAAAYAAEQVVDPYDDMPCTGTISYEGIGVYMGNVSVDVDNALVTDALQLDARVRLVGLGPLLSLGWPSADTLWRISIIDDFGSFKRVRLGSINPDGTLLLIPKPSGPQAHPAPATLRIVTEETRHTCNIVFDRVDEDVWTAVTRVARTGRGSVVPFGSSIQFLVQRDEVPVHIFSEANIVEKTLTISGISPENDFNIATAEILNEQLGWERDPIMRQSPQIQNGSDFKREIRKSVSFPGVTSPGQAMRELDIMLATNEKLRSSISFEAYLDAINLRPGDVFYFAHRLPAWDTGGRVYSDAASASEITIDMDFTLSPLKTYRVAHCAQNGIVSSAIISTPTSGTIAAGTTLTLESSLDAVPERGDLVVVGEEVSVTRLYRVARIGLAQDFRRRIEAVGYDATIYDEAALSFANQNVNTLLPIQPPRRGSGVRVRGLTAIEATIADQVTGQLTPTIFASWNVPDDERHRVQEFVIYARTVTQDLVSFGELERVRVNEIARVGRDENSVQLAGHLIAIGSQIQLFVQARTFEGAVTPPLSCPSTFVTMRGNIQRQDYDGSAFANRYGQRIDFNPVLRNGRGATLEVRQGGWILGMRIASGEGGSDSLQVDEFADASDNSAGDGAMLVVARERLSSGEYAGHYTQTFGTDELHDEGLDADTFAVRQEDHGFSATPPGATGSPVLTEMTVAPDGVVTITPGSPSLNPSWQSSTFDTGLARRYRVNFSIRAWQIHPAGWSNIDAGWDSLTASNWSWEGPLFEPWDHSFETNMVPKFEIRYSTSSTPSGDWQVFRPGVYYGRSFQFRARFRRVGTDFDVQLEQAAIRIHPTQRVLPERVIGGTF